MASFKDPPPFPPSFKSLNHYMKIARDHASRDPVITYYSQLYTLQKGMSIDKQSTEARKVLTHLMDVLETMKRAYASEEAIQNEMVGQAHVENYAMTLFQKADNDDRNNRITSNTAKTFYSAGMIFDVLSNFGDLTDDVEEKKKYAKLKAAYIHRCLKTGETPTPGPFQPEGDTDAVAPEPGPAPIGFNPDPPQPVPRQMPPSQPAPVASQHHYPPQQPAQAVPQQPAQWQPPPANPNVQLKAEHYQKAMKLCKYASSALQYEDSKTAIDNLTKALTLLQTGNE